MSRLYNTLEKIRTGEPGGFSTKKSVFAKGIGQIAEKSKKRRFVLLGVSAVLGLALAAFFAGPKHKTPKTPVVAETVSPAITVPAVATDATAPAQTPNNFAEPAPQNAPAPPPGSLVTPLTNTGDLYQQLNDTGLALIQNNQPWRGIYYLDQAHKQQPEKPEALINMAVALAELGLRAPAKRLFSEAHALAPNHPLLRKNLDILVQADFFDSQWLSSLTAGQATKPQ